MKIAILYTRSEFTKYNETITAKTINDICDAIVSASHTVEVIEFQGYTNPLKLQLQKHDLVFNMCYGYCYDGVDITQDDVVWWLDENKIPHTTTGHKGQEMCADKLMYYKALYRVDMGFHLPPYILPSKPPEFVVLKPRYGSCSNGISIVRGDSIVYPISNDLIAQEWIGGREFTIGMISNRKGGKAIIFPPIEKVLMEPHSIQRFYYHAKPTIDEKVLSDIHECMNFLAKELKLIGMTRVDFKVRDGKVYLLDVNAMPNMSSLKNSLFMDMIGASGYTFDEVVLMILKAARQ